MNPRSPSATVAVCLILFMTPCLRAGRQERVDVGSLVNPVYDVTGDSFVRRNGNSYCNRPLYCHHTDAIVLGGDKPYVVLGAGKEVLGSLMFALVRKDKGEWLQNASDITSIYRPGRMDWRISDPSWSGTKFFLEALPTSQGAGMALKLRVENPLPGDSLVWASGGTRRVKRSVLWEYDMTSQKNDLIRTGFRPSDCAGNEIRAEGNAWSIRNGDGKSPESHGRCGSQTHAIVADASLWENPLQLGGSSGGTQPLACGSLTLIPDQTHYWTLESRGTENEGDPETAFKKGLSRMESLAERVVVRTPDPWLDAAVGASVAAMEGCFRDGFYTHSGMRWGVPLLGWRTLYGGTVYGSHDHVLEQAQKCLARQITESGNTTAVPDPTTQLSSQAPESRIFGKGRVDLHHPHHYDMQSQFFDQLQHAWRWSGNPELEKLLRPSLDLHCEYIRDCFDPSGRGIYESYANSWPTDDQWYNGGGTSEETSYAYAAEIHAARLAERAGDHSSSAAHAANAERIRKAFLDLLWVKERGHPGAYREQGGLGRLHESAWLYSIFCPIDAGLLDREQAAEALHYTEWALERVKPGYGGEQCWPSNWLPSIWSVREMWPGDNYQLALAYFQAGLGGDGWKLLKGTFPQQLLFGPVPGDMGHAAGGTDFNDCNGMFARTVIEGLFGYTPDYPAGVVALHPQFPFDWNQASLQTPDISLSFERHDNSERWYVGLAKKASLEVQIPVSTTAVSRVTLNGKSVPWRSEPGFGISTVNLRIAETNAAEIMIECADRIQESSSVEIRGVSGELVTLSLENGKLIDFHDPQGVLANASIVDGKISGKLAGLDGDHLVFGLCMTGKTTRWILFKIHDAAPPSEHISNELIASGVQADATWDPIPIQQVFNADVRGIFHQKYLSPRPNTCSLRLATDGCSTWQMVLDKKNHPPEIDLSGIPSLLDGKGLIRTAQGIPFLWNEGAKNIAFTSLWDNWPRSVSIPVDKKAGAVWFLLCGSTNPMQVRIANAEIRIEYADATVEKVPVVPPFNFWSLCPFGGIDYDYARDGFSLPKNPPRTLRLGNNCRAVVIGHSLKPGKVLKSVTMEALSQEVVIGLMGMTLMNTR